MEGKFGSSPKGGMDVLDEGVEGSSPSRVSTSYSIFKLEWSFKPLTHIYSKNSYENM